ncbi:MAG: DUF177 domain-containing protein [Ruminococcus sp.]|nr:DUF177 domain-containing protein [Ruminococcus sp.]
MLLQLKEVFLNDGSRQRFDYSLPMSDFEISGDYPFKSPVKVSAEAVNRAGLVELKINAVFDYTTRCDRCFEEITKHMEQVFVHGLATSLIDDENDDYIETPDYTLELDEVVISDIVLNLPSKMLCKDDCKGLCPVCGKNLNLSDCGCDSQPVDSRLEILKQLIDQE